MASRGKPSVFAALNQLQAFDSDDGSADERQQERKEKQKQKKKSRNKKKNSDSALLKDLAFVSVSKPKKSKGKKKAAHSPAGSPEEAEPVEPVVEQKEPEVEQPRRSLADLIKATPQPQQAPVVSNGVEKKAQPAPQQKQQKQQQQPPQQQPKKVASPPKQQKEQAPPPQQKQQQQSVVPPPAPVATAPPAVSAPQSSSETELGAVYTPTHITITRVDGQMKRTVAVTEVMDQLLRYTQQNAQLLMVQEQLGHANRSLQDQLQRSAEIINGLQNEVTMFRQMCLNLQAEVSLLRSSAPAATGAPDAGSNPQPQHHRPPPGMS